MDVRETTLARWGGVHCASGRFSDEQPWETLWQFLDGRGWGKGLRQGRALGTKVNCAPLERPGEIRENGLSKGAV